LYAIVLAGGYATRLWPLTKGTPKALLPIAGKPILNYIVEKLQSIQPTISPIVVSTNMLFQPQFESWLSMSGYRDVMLIPDCASSETEKPGAIKAMATIIEKLPEDDVLVIAGDGMFNDPLIGMTEVFNRKKAPVVALYQLPTLQEAKRCGVAEVGRTGKIIAFTEKPAEPKTRMGCAAIYVFPITVRKRLTDYLSLGLPSDQPGRFVEWLYKQEPVYSYYLQDYLCDIGTHQAYKECDKQYSDDVGSKGSNIHVVDGKCESTL
jgi:glucose-1-phosphate thymidylyltransferase